MAQSLNPSVAFAPTFAPAPFSSLPSSASLDTNLAGDQTPRNSPKSPCNFSPVNPAPPPETTPKILPRHHIIIDSSSDYYSSSPIQTKSPVNMSSTDQAAHVQSHGGRQPSTIGPGHLRDPHIMSRYADVGIAYIHQQQQKGVALLDILSNFVGGLSENLAVVTWFKQNEPHLTLLSFLDFMSAFHDRFLPSTWKKDLANGIWQETMTPGAIFIDWIEHLRGHNGLLASYPEFITDNVFLLNLHGRISKPLQDTIRNIPEIRECNDLDAWTKLVTVQDDELRRKRKELEDVVEATMAVRNKHIHIAETMPTIVTPSTSIPAATSTASSLSYCPPPQRRTNSAPSSGSSLNTPYMYRYQSHLEANERATLAANEGCFAYHDIDIPKAKQGYGKCK